VNLRRILSTGTRVAIIALISTLFSVQLIGAETGKTPSRAKLDSSLIPVYQHLMNDTHFLALRDALINSRGSSESLERILEYLPMSPLEIFKIQMELNRSEYMIPGPIVDLHRQWITIRPDLARKQYGTNYVDRILGGKSSGTSRADIHTGTEKAQQADVDTNRNVAATAPDPPDEYQGEIQLAVNPENPDQVIAAANSMDDCGWGPTQAVFHSSNGGRDWDYTCAPGAGDYQMVCDTQLMPIVFGSDPAVWWDDQGNAFIEYMLLCGDALLMGLGVNPGFAIVVSSSTDSGVTWNGRGVIVDHWDSSEGEDKNFYAIDRSPSSPYHGRHYTCWDRNNDEKLAYSANGGADWTEIDIPDAASGTLDLGCELALDDDGTVNMIFDTLTCGTDSCSNEQMFFTKSTDGGTSWSTPRMIADFNLVSFSGANKPGPQDSRGINPFGAIEVDHSGGTCDGNLYAVFSDFTTGTAENTDVFLSRSTDGGNSWGTPVKINDDGLEGRAQFHPTMIVDQDSGFIYVAWHDARNDSSNHAVDYYIARSTDCGVSFETNIQASRPSSEFNNASISASNANTSDNSNANPNQYGEYMGLDVVDDTAYLAWSDSRHFFPNSSGDPQKENLGFTAVSFAPAESPLFADGFEIGSFAAWSSTMGALLR